MKAGDALRRGTRTLIQTTFVASILVLLQSFGWVDWTPQQVTAVMAVATPVVGFIQNLLEDNTSMPALLKAPASAGKNPIPDSTTSLQR